LQAKIHNYEALSLRRMTLTINGKSNAVAATSAITDASQKPATPSAGCQR